MANSKNFDPKISLKSTSERSISDPIVEEEVKEEEAPTPQRMIDALYYVLMERLDIIEKKIDELHG